MSKKNKRQAPRQLSSISAKAVEFNPDYSIIKRDLKRIGLLAGTFFGILIVLAIFQNQLIGLFVK
ncbi:MAG TPA: hypothetical protein VF359_03605 [Anaerolineales bacterium]|jgi:hypothetical protein